MLITIKKGSFSSKLFLIFSLVRTAFLSSKLFYFFFSSGQPFCQAICFNFFSNYDSFFIKHIKFEKCKELIKILNEEIMPVAWHPNRWWDWMVHVRRWEKRNRSNVYWKVAQVYVGSTQLGGIEVFCFLRYWNILISKFIKILNYINFL